ncbi:MAG: hypothetical protein JXL80_01415 [Planctomycetes bacterium]|nr:hypothetical protein [Planctomycetota bacterium]
MKRTCCSVAGLLPLLAIALVVAAVNSPVAWAQGTGGQTAKSDLQSQQVEQLLERIKGLEGRLQKLESDDAKQEARVRQLELLKELKATNQGDGQPILSTTYGDVRLKLYGYLKTDMSINTDQTNNVDLSIFANSPAGAGAFRDDNEFGLTARQSRIGLEIYGPKAGDWDLKGRFEVDFWNAPYGEFNEVRNNLRLRLAYIEISNPDTMIRAGQDWEIMSPLNPTSINYAYMAWQGNLGYRRPQVRVTHRVSLDKEKKNQWILEGSINRPQGWGGGIDEGVDGDLPVFEGRTALKLQGWTSKSIEIGTSGHWGREEVDGALQNAANRVYTYSGNLDVVVPVTETVSLRGEYYNGENLDQFFGGCNQGVNAVTGEEVRAQGGWVEASWQAMPKLQLNLGWGSDDPNENDLVAGDILRNQLLYLNAIYKITQQLHVGVEVSKLWTSYVNQADGENFRVQSALWLYF